MTDVAFYHGTRKGFTRNGYLFPVDFHGNEPREDLTAWAYVTTDYETAERDALQAKGKGRAKVLTVEPLGELEPNNERGHQYRSKAGFRVTRVRLVSPDVDESETA